MPFEQLTTLIAEATAFIGTKPLTQRSPTVSHGYALLLLYLLSQSSIEFTKMPS